MSSSELQALFSNLRPRSRDPSSNTNVPNSSTSPQAASSFLSNPHLPSTPPPPFSATDNSFRFTNSDAQNATGTNDSTSQNLLNLLNFGRNTSSAAQHEQVVAPTTSTVPSVSASDLVARFMSPTGSRITSSVETTSAAAPVTQSQLNTSRNPLLELLNRQAKAAQESENGPDSNQGRVMEKDIVRSIEKEEGSNTIEPAQSTPSSIRQFGTAGSREHTPFEVPKTASPAPAKPIFTYQNPFEALQASRGQTPNKAVSPAPLQAATPSMTFATDNVLSSTPSAVSARKKLTPKLRSQRSGTSPPSDANLHVNHGEVVALPSTHSTLAVREKQPTIETPGVSHLMEVVEDDAAVKQKLPPEIQQQPSESFRDPDTMDVHDAAEEWEDVPEKSSTSRLVPVYNFPIKAFVSITLQFLTGPQTGIRDDGIMEISRLKKEFDQLDRSLAAATSRYISYAFTKSGGVRIIRQDDGSDRHVFKHTHDRVFNVSFCTTATAAPPTDNQAVLGTGVSGAVYYATVSKEGNDIFEKNQLESESLVFPPWPQGDENTAGGVLKTRAKRSSRHPEFFAIGRGKSIHLIWPATAMSPKYGISDGNRTVDVEKLYQDRPLQISTGKAGKDFNFSEDDTMIVSLDKTGRLRFWDIRNLVDESNATAARVNPVNVDMPMLSLSTASPAEKSWPTSVLFVDKARPYNKGGAQRYVLVGLRQNHTLQLWDIALGKAVQELNFPHKSETDGICSVNYHPGSGIIVVGHPTRNSIFFIHLSAPRYALGSLMTQADYVSKAASKDSSLPKPDSTACMSGIREISFAAKGDLRSIEVITVHKSSDSSKPNSDTSPLFELYVVHSKGVTCLGINREDLGWNSENKVIEPRDALKEGLVTLKDLKLGSVIEEPIRSKSPVKEVVQQPAKTSKKKSKKIGSTTEENTNGLEQRLDIMPVEAPETSAAPDVLKTEIAVQDDKPSVTDIGTTKETKKNKKKTTQATTMDQASDQALPRVPSPPKVAFSQTNGKPVESIVQQTAVSGDQFASSGFGISEDMLRKELEKIDANVSHAFKAQLDALYHNIHEDRSTQDQIASSRHETVLRIVSDSLTNNVEKSLTRIVSQQIQQTVVPVVAQSASVEVRETLAKSLDQIIPAELGRKLPDAITTALQNAQVVRNISTAVSQQITKDLQTQIAGMVTSTLTPILKTIANASAKQAITEVETELHKHVQQLQTERDTENNKIDKLGQVVQGMATALQAMSESQVAFQGQILKDRREVSSAGHSSTTHGPRQVSTVRASPAPAVIARPVPVKVRSKAEIELDDITSAMASGKYEEATIKWLQSSQPIQIFDEVFVRFTPDYLLTDVSPLVAFSVAVTVGNSLSTHMEQRLEWISTAFDAVDPSDPELIDLASHAPALINSLIQKLESLYMVLNEQNSGDPILRTIPTLAKKARDVNAIFMAKVSDN